MVKERIRLKCPMDRSPLDRQHWGMGAMGHTLIDLLTCSNTQKCTYQKRVPCKHREILDQFMKGGSHAA